MKVVYFINKHISFGSLEAKKVVIKSHLVHFSFAIFTLLAVREVDPDPKWGYVLVAVLHTHANVMDAAGSRTAVFVPHIGGIYPHRRYLPLVGVFCSSCIIFWGVHIAVKTSYSTPPPKKKHWLWTSGINAKGNQ
jgi:hypothetical protein